MIVALLVISAAVFLAIRWLRIRNLGKLSITTSSVAYDEASFGSLFSWDKNCFYINSKPVWIHSGEFHYWRLPDKSRWREVLLEYKAAGLNCIRIYFCWAYHSPDLYGFDKYVVFCPISNPFTIPSEKSKNKSTWTEWSPKDVISAFASTETTVRGFGGGAASSPIFIPELQGGWFNHYTVGCTFDDVFSYYGDEFTKMVSETAISQGSTAFNIYMFYGGTNWGTLGDPDVYTSYDYSAAIREYGHISSRARKLRLTLAFAKSFSPELLKTECNDVPVRSSFTIQSSASKFIAKQRKSLGPTLNPVYFVFFRNFNDFQSASSTITVNRYHREPIQLSCKLAYKDSFIGIGNYTTANGLHLILSTLPVYVRTKTASGNEVWIIQSDGEKNGQLAFQGGLDLEGSLDPVSERQDDVTIVSFKSHSGWCRIQNKVDGIKSALYIIALSGNDLYSLTPIFREEYWKETKDSLPAHLPIAVFWGVYQFNYHKASKISAIAQSLHLSSTDGFTPGPLDFILEKDLTQAEIKAPSLPELSFQQTRRIILKGLPWTPLELAPKHTYPMKNPIDFCFLSGHVFYKLVFTMTGSALNSTAANGLVLDVNARHRCSIILNNKSIGGHLTYSLSSLKPGAKQGPDPGRYFGWQKYSLPKSELCAGVNEVFVIVESLGLNRSPGPVDDIRAPRGLLDARIRGVKALDWFIAGVDVRKLDQVYNHSGLPDQPDASTDAPLLKSIPKGIVLPTWFKASFTYALPSESITAPLRLCITGSNTAFVFLNGTLIGRYYKEGPQHDFFLPSGLLLDATIPNTLEVLTFGIEDGSDLHISLKHWVVDGGLDGSLIANASGNLDDVNGVPFLLQSHSLAL